MSFDKWLGDLSDGAFQRLKWALSAVSGGLASALIVAIEV